MSPLVHRLVYGVAIAASSLLAHTTTPARAAEAGTPVEQPAAAVKEHLDRYFAIGLGVALTLGLAKLGWDMLVVRRPFRPATAEGDSVPPSSADGHSGQQVRSYACRPKR